MKHTHEMLLWLSVSTITISPALGQSLQEVHTTAALKALTPTSTLQSVLKDGYFAQGDMPAVNYLGTTSACTLKNGNGDGGYQIKPTAGGCWIASPPVVGWPLQIWGPHADGTTDDTATIRAALDICHTTNGGGKVLLGPKQYLVSAGNISIPGGCVLSAPFWPGLQQGNGQYASLIYAIILDPAYTFNNVSGNELNNGIENILFMSRAQYAAGPPATLRAALTDIAQFSGTAVTLGGGNDFLLRNVTMIGFNTCVNITYNQRPAFDHVYGDCTNGIVAAQIFDVAKWSDLEIYPALLNYGNTLASDPNAPTAFTFSTVSNGGGRYCLGGLNSNPNLTPQTGDTVNVTGVGGAVGANGKFTITVNGSGCNPGVLLNESVVAPAPVATVKSGSQWVTLNVTPPQWVYWKGQTVSDSAGYIPTGATIDKVWIGLNLIHITKIPTNSTSSDNLTIGNPSYTSGGTLYYDLGLRSGVGFSIADSTGVPCWNCFEFGHQIGVHLSGSSIDKGADGVIFTGGGLDSNGGLGDPTTIGILIDTYASGAQFVGFNISSYGRAAVVQNSGAGNTSPDTFIGGQYLTTMIPGGYYGPSFEFNSYWTSLISNASASGDVEISDAIRNVQYGGLSAPNASVVFQSFVGQNLTQQDGASVLQSGGPLVGTPGFGTVTAGLLNSGVIRQSTTTVGGLPAFDPVPAIGDRAIVTDAVSCAYNSPVSGGGSTTCPVVYNNRAQWVGG